MQKISQIISEAIKNTYNLDFTPDISPAPKPELGEYCVNIFPLVKQVGKAPNIISEEVGSALAKHADIFRSTSATGGYVNFFLADSIWLDIFGGLSMAWSEEGKWKTIIVDYIGANVGKPLHIGHICTPSIGQVICNTYRHLGYEVIGDSHFGDWGGIFGKLISAFKRRIKMDSSEWHEKALLEDGWVNYLINIYQFYHQIAEDDINWSIEVESRAEFQYLSWIGIDLSNPEELRHHEENVELWKRFTSISIAETERKLELLGVHATYNIGESFYEWLWLPRPNDEKYPNLQYKMKDIVAELITKWIATQNDDGSVGIVFSEESKLPSCILQKKDGTGLYLTSDLAAIKYRLTNGWNPSKIIYSVDVRQQLHLRQAFAIAKMAWGEELGAKDIEFFHAFNGFIKLKEWAMSTRHGTVIFLEVLIEEGKVRTAKILEEKWRTGENSLSPENIEAITIGAIKYSYLTQDREKDVVFDWDKALNFEGHSGPYIQYAYVRAIKIVEGQSISEPVDEDVILSSHDKSLIQTLSRFEEAVANTAKTYKPHHIALYAYELAWVFNSFYVHTPKILEETDTGLKNLRLILVKNTAETLAKSFDLLAIAMPSEM